jgi:hypothetical protein
MVGFHVNKCSAACAEWNDNFKWDYAFSTIFMGTGIKKNIYNLQISSFMYFINQTV